MRGLLCFTWILCGLLLPPFVVAAGAQGLGDVASREKQKRQAQPKPARVYTEEDLDGTKGIKTPEGASAPAATPPGSESVPAKAGEANRSSAATAASPAPASGGTAHPSARPDVAEAEREIERDRQERILLEAEWRTRFADARQRLAVAEAGAWRDTNEVVIYAGRPINIKKRVHVETDDLTRARRQLAELEEEFRRTGLPAGWAREE